MDTLMGQKKGVYSEAHLFMPRFVVHVCTLNCPMTLQSRPFSNRRHYSPGSLLWPLFSSTPVRCDLLAVLVQAILSPRHWVWFSHHL